MPFALRWWANIKAWDVAEKSRVRDGPHTVCYVEDGADDGTEARAKLAREVGGARGDRPHGRREVGGARGYRPHGRREGSEEPKEIAPSAAMADPVEAAAGAIAPLATTAEAAKPRRLRRRTTGPR